MSFKVRYTVQARADNFRNSTWWAEHHSLDQALEWEALVQKQIATLDSMPERHGFAVENDKFAIEIRQMLVGIGPRPSYRVLIQFKTKQF